MGTGEGSLFLLGPFASNHYYRHHCYYHPHRHHDHHTTKLPHCLFQRSTLHTQHCLLPPVSYLLSPTSCLLPPVSYLLSPTSCLLPPVSYLSPPTSRPSNKQHPPSPYRPLYLQPTYLPIHTCWSWMSTTWLCISIDFVL